MVHRQIVPNAVLPAFVAWIFADFCAVAEYPVVDLFEWPAVVWCFEEALKDQFSVALVAAIGLIVDFNEILVWRVWRTRYSLLRLEVIVLAVVLTKINDIQIVHCAGIERLIQVSVAECD